MKSVVKLDINVPQARLAELFANAENSPRWMDDLDRYEAISGEPGMPGSKYRLVPKKGAMVFIATVIAKDLPVQARVNLDAPNVAVSVTGTFEALSPFGPHTVGTWKRSSVLQNDAAKGVRDLAQRASRPQLRCDP